MLVSSSAATECWCGVTEDRKCYSLKVLKIEHMCTTNFPQTKNKRMCRFRCVQSDQAANRKYHRADCVNLVLITPTHISALHLHFVWVVRLRAYSTPSHWPWLCLWGRSRSPKLWVGSNVSSTTSSHPPSATGHPRSPALTPSHHRNTPDRH